VAENTRFKWNMQLHYVGLKGEIRSVKLLLREPI
jgi:hypothetical protein